MRLSGTRRDKIQNVGGPDQALSGRVDKSGQKALPILRQSENLQVSGHFDGRRETVCKTVGSEGWQQPSAPPADGRYRHSRDSLAGGLNVQGRGNGPDGRGG